MTCLPADLILDDASLSAIRAAGYSRIPVCRPLSSPSSLAILREEEGAAAERPLPSEEALTPPRGGQRGGNHRCVGVLCVCVCVCVFRCIWPPTLTYIPPSTQPPNPRLPSRGGRVRVHAHQAPHHGRPPGAIDMYVCLYVRMGICMLLGV